MIAKMYPELKSLLSSSHSNHKTTKSIEDSDFDNIFMNFQSLLSKQEDEIETQMKQGGLGKYHSKLINNGITTIDSIRKTTTEEFNKLLIPAPIQVKIKKMFTGFTKEQIFYTQTDTHEIGCQSERFDLESSPNLRAKTTKTKLKENKSPKNYKKKALWIRF